MERISTGVSQLDELLHGGFPKGASILIAGKPGSGKTIFAHQMAFHNPEKKVLYLTTLAEPMVKVLKYLQEFSFFQLKELQRNIIFQDLGSLLRQQGKEKVLALVRDLLKEHQPALVVIDAIKTLSDMFQGSLNEWRDFIYDLSLQLTVWGCTALLLGEYSEGELEMRSESAIVDGIVVLSGTEETKQQKRFLKILKMRGTDFTGGEIFFRITGDGLNIYPRFET